MRSFFFTTILLLISSLTGTCDQPKVSPANDKSTVSNIIAETPVNNSPTLTICEITKDVARFDHREVEFTAVMIDGREYAYLYEPNCRGHKNELAYEIKEAAVNEKLRPIFDAQNPSYMEVGLARTKADFTGTLIIKKHKKDNGFGHLGYFLYELQIRDVKNVSYVGRDVPYPWQ